jgi:hypothetical protein
MRPLRYVTAALSLTAAAVTVSLLVLPAPALADETGLVVTTRTSDPLKPVMVLTNRGAQACQVVGGSSLGTVAYTRVEQGGVAVEALPVQVTFPEHAGFAMARRLVTVQPGGSVEVPLAVVPLGPTGNALEMVTWSEAAGPFAALYPLRAEGSLVLRLSYQVPITGDGSVPVCVSAAESSPSGVADEPASTKRWVVWAVVGVVLLLGLILAVLLIRRRRRAASAAVLVLLAVVAGLGAAPRQAYADITVTDPSLQKSFDYCMGLFSQPGHDPAGILPVLNDPSVNVRIQRPSAKGDDHEIASDSKNMWIFWDPETPYTYHGSGGPQDPCSSLYHEMHHAKQHATDTYNMDPCRTTDPAGRTLPRTEVLATHAQNALRAKMGLPQRDHYGDVPLPDTCEPPEPPRRCEGGNCGTSNGDPHLRTFDGGHYDFQAVGEFILARQPAGGYEVQVRQVPATAERIVSVNSAVALAVGQDKVEVRTAGVELALLIGGAPAELKNTTLPDGGKIEADRHEVIVTWKDGSVIYVRPIARSSLRVVLDPAAGLAGKLEGLLGDFDGDPANDIRHRGGATVKEPTFDALYPAYADSWRVNATTSLFTYDPGTSPETYVDRKFPDRQVSVEDLPNRAAAEDICRRLGVTDPDVFAGCVLDVALTGQAEFAAAAASGQAIVGRDFGGDQHVVRIDRAGSTAKVTFTGKAGQQIFVDVPTTTLPNACGAMVLSGPSGDLARGCLINGRGYIDSTKLPSDATYTITLDPDGATGVARLHIITITDQAGTLTSNGPTVAVNIDKPGVVGRFTFAGRAGQRVFVDAPRSTLPHECGVLQLQGPAGQLKTGCVIYGDGEIETTTLPANGTYTVLVDPNDNTVGTVTLSLTSPTDQTGTIAVNGPAVTAEIRQKGAIASFTFTGSSRQRVFVEVQSSTLPNECGLLTLSGPGGFTRQGCVINGTGGVGERDGLVLPASGTYTLTVDPDTRTTGQAVIRVRT